MTLQELGRSLKEKQDEIGEFIKKHKTDKGLDFSVDDLGEFNKRNDELTEMGKQYDGMKAVEAAALKHAEDAAKRDETKRPGFGGGDPSANGNGSGNGSGREFSKSIGELFIESEAFTLKRGNVGPVARVDVDTKSLFQTSTDGVGAGWKPQTLRTGKVLLSAQEMPAVVDLIPKSETGQAAVVYMEETLYTNNAAETSEGGQYGEAALALTQKSSPVQKIAVFLPVTDEQLEDVPQVRDYVNNRLGLMLEQRLDLQLVAGNGAAPNLRGIHNVVGIQSQPKGGDPQFDAIYKAMVKIRVTGKAMASGILMHPNDWQDIRLARTVEGIYILGSPTDPGPDRLFGLPVVQSTNATENTGIVGDFATYTELSMRRGVEFQISNSHSTYFIEGKQAIRADFRCAFMVYRPAALCEVTGL